MVLKRCTFKQQWLPGTPADSTAKADKVCVAQDLQRELKKRNGRENGEQAEKRDSRKENTAYTHSDCGGKAITARDCYGSAGNQDEARPGTHGAK